MRMSCDTGGTFTDLAVEFGNDITMFKSPTTPQDPIEGILNAVQLAATQYGHSTSSLLADVDTFLHATTRSLNAVLTGNVARTAFLTTRGHPDVLVIREGGRSDPFNYSLSYPRPYVPRALTFEVTGRVNAAGDILRDLDEEDVIETLRKCKRLDVEAIGVSLLWSISNNIHEKRVGRLIEKLLPGLPFTLSHELNPALREYRRASAACMDASLKPTMNHYLQNLKSRLVKAGFKGRLLMVTSQGGVMDGDAVAAAPIHAVNSGPAMAPVAGRFYARRDTNADVAIVTDTGGTSYDVSVVRQGRIPRTRETWIGQPFQGHMTGFPSVDVTSVGAGGGSIAWVDEGELLHVGPHSAGALPGPACYGRGGSFPTVTDCALILGYIDPAYFLGGTMPLNLAAAREAVDRHVSRFLGISIEQAALAIMAVTTERMIGAIENIAVNQGIDTSRAVLVGGGGAGGLNAVSVGRRLGCRSVLIPESGAALSAVGALMSELYGEFTKVSFMTSGNFDRFAAKSVIEELKTKCKAFIARYGQDSLRNTIEIAVEARYPKQIWEIEIPLACDDFHDPNALKQLVAAFHAEHRALFQISDDASGIEIIAWRASVRCALKPPDGGWTEVAPTASSGAVHRPLYLSSKGWTDVPVRRAAEMASGERLYGPAIVESPFTTIVVDPGAVASRTRAGSLLIEL